MSINCSKILVLALLLAFACQSAGQDAAYWQLYSKECGNAKDFYTQHKNLLETSAQSTGLMPQMLFAIVAPEFTQYSHLSNKVETLSLKVLYVQGGKSYSDFSIGIFQMKPSFIERMEEYVLSDSVLCEKYAGFLFAAPDERKSRVARIDRLNTAEWQIKYLTLFCEILQKRFAGYFSGIMPEEQLRFYASAYNCGFHKTEQQIKDTERRALFPHFSRQKFKYSDIAVQFFISLE